MPVMAAAPKKAQRQFQKQRQAVCCMDSMYSPIVCLKQCKPGLDSQMPISFVCALQTHYFQTFKYFSTMKLKMHWLLLG